MKVSLPLAVSSEDTKDDSVPELEASLSVEVLYKAETLCTNGASVKLESF